MPVNPTDASTWYHQQFLHSQKARQLHPDKPEDWSRLQVWDGQALVPALPQGFHGTPSNDQLEFIYSKMKQGELFLFKLGETTPTQIMDDKQNPIAAKPTLPKKPKAPRSKNDWEKNGGYAVEETLYKAKLRYYQVSRSVHDKCGPGFQESVNRYNASRDLSQESKEFRSRSQCDMFQEHVIIRGRADRIISDFMKPRPIAPPEIYYSDKQQSEGFVLDYESFNNIIEPNGYDLPNQNVLNDYDAATINLAMTGARSEMAKYLQENEQYGPVFAQLESTNGFNMFFTGMFGKIRKNLDLEPCLGHAMQLGKESIDAYLNDNDPSLLGRRLGECVQNIKLVFTGVAMRHLTQDTVAGTKLTERLLDLFTRKPDILKATGLNDQDLDFMRGYVQMGHIYDNALASCVKLEDALARGKTLTTQEKAEILANTVIRKMVEKEMAKDSLVAESDPVYVQKKQEAAQKDEVSMQQLEVWMQENPLGDQNAHMKQNDINAHALLAQIQPLDHPIIHKLAQPGMLEQWRQTLMQDPGILAAAAKEPFAFKGTMLLFEKSLDGIVNQLEEYNATTDAQKRDWFENFKDMVSFGGDGQVRDAQNPWITSGVSTDITRLRIAVPNAQGGKDLVEVGRLLQGGLMELENPSAKTIDLMYRNAMEGNLYYYQAGKDMPQRIGASGTRASMQQLVEPKEPTRWQRFLNIITFGFAYAAICNPTPDRDPAAMAGILRAKEGRVAVIESEVSNHNRVLRDQADPAAREESFRQARITNDIDNFRNVPVGDGPRTFPSYDPDIVFGKAKTDTYGDLHDPIGSEKNVAFLYYISATLCRPDASEELIRRAMAAAVLVEAIREEHLAQNGNTMRNHFNENHKEMVEGMMKNPAFLEFTKGASQEMLRHFIMVGGARNMYRGIQELSGKMAGRQAGDQPKAPDHDLENQPKEPSKQISNIG